MKNENEKNNAKQDLLIIDTETGLLSHPSTLERVSSNSGILFPNLFGASSERITMYFSVFLQCRGSSRSVTVLSVIYFFSPASMATACPHRWACLVTLCYCGRKELMQEYFNVCMYVYIYIYIYIYIWRKNPQHAFLRRGSKAVGPMS